MNPDKNDIHSSLTQQPLRALMKFRVWVWKDYTFAAPGAEPLLEIRCCANSKGHAMIIARQEWFRQEISDDAPSRFRVDTI